jgi:cardiolipin synthase
MLLESGVEFFPALIAAIDAALSEVWLETYIFAGDATGRRVAEALANAARRGVSVKLVIDGYGTRTLDPDIAELLDTSGVHRLVYSPMPRWVTLDRSRLRRLHRKLACVDLETAFVGGINVLDDLWDPNHGVLEHPRLDYAVQIRGAQVLEIREAMSRVWNSLVTPTKLDRLVRARRRVPPRPVRLVLRDSFVHRRAIEREYLRAIGQARHEVLIATAYFFPGRRFRRALREARRRGVRVRLLLQGKPEYLLPHRAARALYDSLLSHGVEIVEYRRSFLHAKVAVIDDWATVGSSNIDPFSLLLAREANLVVIDRRFAQHLRERLDLAMLQGGQTVHPDDHRRRPLWERALGWFAYSVLRLGVLVSGEQRRY